MWLNRMLNVVRIHKLEFLTRNFRHCLILNFIFMEKNLLSQFGSENVLSKSQMKSFFGGNESLQQECPEGWFWCSCTSDAGKVSGCVHSIDECYSAC